MTTQFVIYKRQYSLFVNCLLLFGGNVGFAQTAPERAAAPAAVRRDGPQEDSPTPTSRTATAAPTGFDFQTNGFVDQATMDEARLDFAEVETPEDGLGPVFNDSSCAACHQSPLTGGGGDVRELRAGRYDGTRFIEHPGGSLIQSRAINPAVQEQPLPEYTVHAQRLSPSLFGLGYIEAVSNLTLAGIALRQRALSGGRIAGEIIRVNVLEASGRTRSGRFGWKNQHASLLSFSADAYLNEMGVTSPLLPVENTSNGAPVNAFDSVADPEDDGTSIRNFATFIRSLKAPPRDTVLAATEDARAGERVFERLGCQLCHVSTLATAPAGTRINGGTFAVPPALGDKIIRPYSDFLLHDVGTGDGIVQNGGPSTRNKIRTAPLWGLRTRERLMHDGESLTRAAATSRHGGEAAVVSDGYRRLPETQKALLDIFLRSL